jgi:uncharacterized protein (TIGR02453 family)
MYFNQGYIDFFEQLHKNNSRQWFKENRKWYELTVREPFKELLDNLLPEIKKLDEGIHMNSSEALFRINRDLRYFPGKKPYKTHMAAGFTRGGRKSQYAGYFLQIGLHHIVIGGGLPFLEKESLKKIRIEIAYKSDTFKRIISDSKFKSLYGFIHGESEKEIPTSFSDFHEEYPVIANKQFYYGTLYKTNQWLFNNELPKMIIDHFRAGVEFNNFMIKAISNFVDLPQTAMKRKVLKF